MTFKPGRTHPDAEGRAWLVVDMLGSVMLVSCIDDNGRPPMRRECLAVIDTDTAAIRLADGTVTLYDRGMVEIKYFSSDREE